MHLHIRRATTDDLELLLRWRKGMAMDMDRWEEARIDAALPAFADWLRPRLARPEEIGAVIGMAGDVPITGAIAWVHDWYPTLGDTADRRGYLFNVYTEPAWRRRGCAGQVVAACLDWLRAQGVTTVALHASDTGQSVYARLGFTPPRMAEMVLRVESPAP